MSARSKVLGSCVVCGKPCFGQRARIVHTDYQGKGVVRDVNGLRHGKCRPAGPGFGTAAGVTVSDA